MRDSETQLDYFGARYYASGLGHWMSPDWASKPTAVPYANFGDPQTLNLYGMVTGNPVSKQDSDGHKLMDYLTGWSSGGANPSSHGFVMGTDPVYSAAWLKANNEIAPGQNSNADFDPSGRSAQQQSGAGTVPVVVGQRPIHNLLLRILSLGLAKHSYFIVEGDMVQVLGNDGSSHNQQVRINDPTRGQRGKEHTIYVSQAQADALVNGSEYFAQHTGSGLHQSDYAHPCPTCSGGQEGYNFLLHNSNSFVYNMLSTNPGGSIPPGSAPAFTPGWAMKPDEWYPNR